MAKELSVLQQQAEAIKTEVNKGANTSSRIGGMFGDMLEYNEEKLTELEFKSKYEYEKNVVGLDVQYSDNLFVISAFLPYSVNDKEIISKSDEYAICRVKVEAGKTYYRYDGIAKSTWMSTNCRLFDDTGFLGVYNDTEVNVPVTAKNPYIYLTIYQGKGDKYMFTENPSPTEYIPATDYGRIKNIEENISKILNQVSNYIGYYSIYNSKSGYIKIDTESKTVDIFGRIFIITSGGLADNNIYIDYTASEKQTTNFEGTDDFNAIYFLFFYKNNIYLSRFTFLQEKIAEDSEVKPVVIGMGNLLDGGSNFLIFGGSIYIDGVYYSYNKKEILDRFSTLDLIFIKKNLNRTSNLFNYQDKTYEGKTISDLGVWSASSTYNTVAVEVEAGKTYKRYSKAGKLNSWGSTNIRVFDNGVMVLKENGTEFTVPEDAINPIAYISYYIDYASNGQTDPSLYMILESTVSGDTQIPYYYVEFEQDLVDYINEQIKNVDITNSIVQGTGQSTDKAMSQKSVTDSLNEQKNSLQTAISNAVTGLTSSQIEQGTGQSTTSTMSQKSISDALEVLAEGLTGDVQYRFAERPESGYENFFVDVDVNIATTNLDTEAVADSINLQKDRCILALPTNYSRSGKPTRLVICGHGTGWKCTAGTTIPWAGMNTQLLLDEGYAVLGCNGTPGDLDGLDQGHNGTPQCYRSILAAYKYVTDKYNIATNGVFTAGLSMGTIMTTQITCFNDIPVLAQVVFSPSFELMKSQFTLKPAIRQRMCEKFGFVGQAPTFTEQDPPSEAEKQYVLDNFDKWCGYDTIINGISSGAKETFDIWPNHAVKEDAEEKALYQDKSITRRVPIKMFVCDDDTTASPRWADYLSIMMRNGGCYCEVRHYATGGHNAWGAGDSIEVSTLLGGKKSVNGASYEGLLFLKRFDL